MLLYLSTELRVLSMQPFFKKKRLKKKYAKFVEPQKPFYFDADRDLTKTAQNSTSI
uniref:Uncharacterized protein n=1 Tax=Anguilla anguilla TaxID=7936 RepID=A0A0E9WZT0_ANGAN